ncbi:MAG: HD domain-containing protein [Candidatus Doudnabacteria bacterium]|nr:HD domain-containing protein [Candidatus Doudnabacteria bacterium]
MKDIPNIVNFLFEAGILSKTPRSFYNLLGNGQQSVAEHLNRVCFVGFVLAKMVPEANENKIIKMCLFHDLAEARTSDLNYVHQKYAVADEGKALAELANTLPFGQEILDLIDERNNGKTLESQLAKDADQIEFLLSLKEQTDTGNSRAESWIPSAVKRLKTESAGQLAEIILKTKSDDWWFADKEDKWWVNRNRE